MNRSLNRRQLVLSVAVSAIVTIIDASYNVTELAKYVDFINLMAYDFHLYTKYWPFTGFNAPLYARKIEKSYFAYLNTNWAAKYWNYLGMSKQKILIGIPTYGLTFILADMNCTSPDCADLGQSDDVTYSDVCVLLRNSSVHNAFDNESMVPYLYYGNNWVTYDDVNSVSIKAKWIIDNEFGGVMTFNLNSDDHSYKCSNDTTFVLHSAIYSVFMNTSQSIKSYS